MLPVIAALPVEPHHLAETLVFALVGLLWAAGMAVALRQADTRAATHGALIAACIAGAATRDEIVAMLMRCSAEVRSVECLWSEVTTKRRILKTLGGRMSNTTWL